MVLDSIFKRLSRINSGLRGFGHSSRSRSRRYAPKFWSTIEKSGSLVITGIIVLCAMLVFYFDYTLACGNYSSGFPIGNVTYSYAGFLEIILTVVVLVYFYRTGDTKIAVVALASLSLAIVAAMLLTGRLV